MRYFVFVTMMVIGCGARSEGPVSRDELVSVRGNGLDGFDEKDYVATTETYRLLGVEPGDGVGPRGAVVADTKTWHTRVIHEGDLLGRSARVEVIDEHAVTLVNAHEEATRLERGRDLTIRIARHRLDVVGTALGRHRHAIEPAAATATMTERGIGATTEAVTIWDKPALRLSTLDPEGLLAKAGFHELDLVVGLDGEPAGSGTLEALASRLSKDGTARVDIVRGGVPTSLVMDRAHPGNGW